MSTQLLLANHCEVPLSDPRVFALDCQSTGAQSAGGHLLEIGWSDARALSPAALMIRLPAGVALPPRITKLTGIQASHLDGAVSPEFAWQALRQVARERAHALGGDAAFVVIHHARFELPFLRALHRRHSPEEAFPLEVLCTREIARRLLPALPRHGLRALAGYFGAPPPAVRRSAEHVCATLLVWQKLVELLAARCGVRTFKQLREWLERKTPRKESCAYPLPRELRLSLPDLPGVYRFRRRDGFVLYVGKATSLRQRVNSYFYKQKRVPERLIELLMQACDVVVTPTESALEAALLETDEIKRLAPPYNVALKTGARQLCFCSADFRSTAAHPSRELPLGPFPSAVLVTSFAALCELLRGAEPSSAAAEHVLGLSGQFAPDEDCFRSGLLAFKQKTLRTNSAAPLEVALLTLGKAVWIERLAEIERERNSTDDLEDWNLQPEIAPVTKWTPARVAAALKDVAARTAHHLRRAAWLCQLSDCSLAFDQNGTGARVLVFEGGVIAARQTVRDGAPPVASGHRKPLFAQQQCFDIATYDRLSVLTAELRRILAEGGAVRLRLNRDVLDRAKIAEELRWV